MQTYLTVDIVDRLPIFKCGFCYLLSAMDLFTSFLFAIIM